ncbi:hypothetical protein [Pseudotenacibaculum haliotis]|uniref:PH domain-containing protein n=1 Tax=Pseudotenacibaculum haliotis TaxID=1862138 RepID=A0ABW5LRH5_9FLAO
MKRKLTILYNTFSFFLVIPILLIVKLLFSIDINIGFIIGWIIAFIISKFWIEPLYVDHLTIDNSKLKIVFTTPFLKKGFVEYDICTTSNFSIKKKNFFTKYSRIRFYVDGKRESFVFLKMDEEDIMHKVGILKQKKELLHSF